MFITVKEKLICLDSIMKLPLENIDIIKSYLFIEINSRPYYEVIKNNKENLHKKIRHGFIARIEWENLIRCQFLDRIEKINVKSVVCKRCGEFDRGITYVGLCRKKRYRMKRLPEFPSKLPKCKCDFRN